jgi:hypothetical protein
MPSAFGQRRYGLTPGQQVARVLLKFGAATCVSWSAGILLGFALLLVLMQVGLWVDDLTEKIDG